MSEIRILLVEDSFVTRLGTRVLLKTQPDMNIVGEAAGGAEGIDLYRQLLPDVAIVDLKIPDQDGIEVTKAIVACDPPGRVLVLTHYEGEKDISEALKAGACGYLTKDAHGDELIAAIRAIHGGDQYFPQDITRRIGKHDQGDATLSPREQEVLDLIFSGKSNQQISDTLAISPKTTSIYVSALLKKLGAQSRTEAIAIGLQRGLLSHR